MNIIAEPIGRNTCSAIVLSTAIVSSRNQNAVLAVFPADHLIQTRDGLFKKTLLAAFDEAAHGDSLITIGITPTDPATGYGYIKRGKPCGNFFKCEQFVEKPDLKTAERYMASHRYLWNAGMFIWSTTTFGGELKRYLPKMYTFFLRWRKAAPNPKALDRILAREYPSVKKVSIDYALMERSRKILCAAGKFEWDDLGSHPAYGKHLPSDRSGNHSQDDAVYVDASGNIVCDARGKKSLTALVGVHDMVVVHTDDATLISSKNNPDKLKELLRMFSADERYKKLL
jgi:mannose-1-phosphate guanylyltransferase